MLKESGIVVNSLLLQPLFLNCQYELVYAPDLIQKGKKTLILNHNSHKTERSIHNSLFNY